MSGKTSKLIQTHITTLFETFTYDQFTNVTSDFHITFSCSFFALIYNILMDLYLSFFLTVQFELILVI